MSDYIPPIVLDDLIRTVDILYSVLAPISRVKIALSITSVLSSRPVVFRKLINVVEKIILRINVFWARNQQY